MPFGSVSITPISVVVQMKDIGDIQSFPILGDANTEIGQLELIVRVKAMPHIYHIGNEYQQVMNSLEDACAQSFLHTLHDFTDMYKKRYPPTYPGPRTDNFGVAMSLLSRLFRFHQTPLSYSTRARLIAAAKGTSKRPHDLVLCDRPAEDVLGQMKYLLCLIVSGYTSVGDSRRQELHALIEHIVHEICFSTILMQDFSERHSDYTYMDAFKNGDTILLQTGEPYNGPTDRRTIVGLLLEWSSRETRAAAAQRDIVDRGLEHGQRSFTAALGSPRGIESDEVCSIICNMLDETSDPVARDFYRRAIARLVQHANKLPKSFYVQLDTSAVPREFARGGFARVYRGSLKSKAVAIKVPDMDSSVLEYHDQRHIIYLEIITWKTTRHTHILPLYGVTSVANIGTMAMVSPYMSAGNLKDVCRASLDSINDGRGIRYLKEIATGMAFLHADGVVHGDLRACNVFLDDSGHVQIADFGLCVFSQGHSRGYFSRRSGNVSWVAPELIAPEQYGGIRLPLEAQPTEPVDGIIKTARPTKESDVYSFACVCVEIFDDRDLYEGKNEIQIIHTVLRPSCKRPLQPMRMQDRLWGIVEKCWGDEPSQRLGFAEIEKLLGAHEV